MALIGPISGSSSETIKEISAGVLQISDKDGKQLFKIESDGTASGLRVTETNPDGTFTLSGLAGNVPPNAATPVTASVTGAI